MFRKLNRKVNPPLFENNFDRELLYKPSEIINAHKSLYL